MLCLFDLVCVSLPKGDIPDKSVLNQSNLNSSIIREQFPSDLSFKTLFQENKIYHYFHYGKDHPFNFSAKTFELINACWLADASMLAYVRDNNYVSHQLTRSGFEHVKFFDESGTQCFVASNAQGVFVIFRGTEPDEIRDILTDAQIITVNENKGGKVHKGFQQGLNSIWGPLFTQIREINSDSNKKFWFSGHSLGAALAVLAAARFQDKTAVQGVYTFGCPQIGNRDYAESYTIPIYRIVNNNDIIPMLPSSIIYDHIGQFIYIDNEGHLHNAPDTWTEISSKFDGHWQHALDVFQIWKNSNTDIIPNDNLTDHAPILYSIQLWNAYIDSVK